MLSHKKIVLLLAATVMAGCVSEPKTIYSWDKYQPTLYQYYQQDKVSPEEQIASLTESIEKAKAKNKPVPPGLHAQLGLLYVNTGRDGEARQQFETEKVKFPESAPFMDFLLSKNKGNIK
ncbi:MULTISPECIES: DUF4810 domain-containing protein [unclassified Brenneria]|uniref:DUF4810 domain-containing protein n=1 Tax=unclassified Brenneria TaxID=2634434 RepID=UPI00155237B3|nr:MULTISPECIES: DUF4810 domain-containing protein [unclassified Brenneria]MBJ7222229.1 DUF4810 domain-containing protein [Brenneria sp. L3-3C-1]MEE3643472.1 DUF4810 domain-containing protein [Brenneria sp. L3_3C_1]MEE3651656.1 DUF4810 domain-containing protein [Brenneria sp. HEZEL_4_2_4]NPD01613.1 DUF4810 domain-containing protein [Brenneria sp. hezel4-2-4]